MHKSGPNVANVTRRVTNLDTNKITIRPYLLFDKDPEGLGPNCGCNLVHLTLLIKSGFNYKNSLWPNQINIESLDKHDHGIISIRDKMTNNYHISIQKR